MDIHEKRKFPRFPVTKPILCFRYGRQITMRTKNISFGGLRLEANLDLRTGESLDFDILTNGTRIHCKGKILGVEDLKDKVQARLRFTPTSESEHRKLFDYLDTLSGRKRKPFEKGIIVGLFILSACLVYLIIRAYFFR
jgi:hypothetical protein